ncbi:MAG: hypothetical protein M0T73_13675 [Deltaproteobacteria bacterium]|nr:hypothetical protein [Deltaproteobacteria bacterium]
MGIFWTVVIIWTIIGILTNLGYGYGQDDDWAVSDGPKFWDS